MKIKKILIYSILLIGFISIAKSQSISVVAGITADKTITIRWFSNSIFNIEGVNIYRRQLPENNWIKLNSVPIKRAESVSKNSSDTMLRIYSALTYHNPTEKEAQETWRLAILTKGILDSEFSKFYGMQYDDKSVEDNKTYEYKVIRIQNGNETEGSISNQVKVENYNPPQAPSGFNAKEGDGIINFKWDTDKKKFFTFNIYRSESATGKKSLLNDLPIFIFTFQDSEGKSTTAEFYYKDTTVINGKTYFYELKGIDFLGRESKSSNTLKVSPKDLTPPPAAYDIKSSINNETIILSWQAEKVKDLKEINVLRGNAFKGPFTKLNKSPLKISDTSFSEVIKNPEPAYFYVIETVDFSGNITKSFPKTVIVPDNIPPAVPEELKAVGDVGKVMLTWKNNKEKDLAGYFIWRSISGDEDDFLLLTTRPHLQNSYIDTLHKEVSNFIIYKIKAIDKAFNESPYSKIVKVKMKDVTPPNKPILTGVVYNEGQFEIKWVMNQEEDLAGYNIFISKEAEPANQRKLNQSLIKTDNFILKDSTIIDGDYLIYITAQDTLGNISEMSDKFSCTVINPKIQNISTTSLTAEYNQEKNIIVLKWNKLIDNNITGYMVFKRAIKEDDADIISGLIQENYFEDTNPEKGKFYYFIRVYDNKGDYSISNEVLP